MDENIQGTPSPSPPPCSKNCGFFGSPSTMGMCSKCFSEHQRSNTSSAAAGNSAGAEPAHNSGSITTSNTSAGACIPVPVPPKKQEDIDILPQDSTKGSMDVATGTAEEEAPKERKVQKNTSRCFSCRKKIGLTGFQCRCGYFYCSEHRYSDKHECDFDYQKSARQLLEKNNPVVVASKLDKI